MAWESHPRHLQWASASSPKVAERAQRVQSGVRSEPAMKSSGCGEVNLQPSRARQSGSRRSRGYSTAPHHLCSARCQSSATQDSSGGDRAAARGGSVGSVQLCHCISLRFDTVEGRWTPQLITCMHASVAAVSDEHSVGCDHLLCALRAGCTSRCLRGAGRLHLSLLLRSPRGWRIPPSSRFPLLRCSPSHVPLVSHRPSVG